MGECFLSMYRGIVANNVDPLGFSRIRAIVPIVFGDGVTQTTWAWPCVPVSTTITVPPVQSGVWISFENGDPEFPVWLGIWSPLAAMTQFDALPYQGSVL